jgi:hypothetical protein
LHQRNGNSLKYRREAFGNFKRLLKEYADVKKATTHHELENAVNGDPQVDPALPFANERQRLLDGIRDSIRTSEHPTVWRKMIRQRVSLPTPPFKNYSNKHPKL